MAKNAKTKAEAAKAVYDDDNLFYDHDHDLGAKDLDQVDDYDDQGKVHDHSHDDAPRRGQLATAKDVKDYLLAGNATITLVSKKTGTRFTYKVTTPPEKNERSRVTHFVALLDGPDNESSFRYLGCVRDDHGVIYEHGRKSKVSADSPSARAFAWFFETVVRRLSMMESLEVWHEGRCGRCGRKLTVPESVERGIGPECAGKMGVP